MTATHALQSRRWSPSSSLLLFVCVAQKVFSMFGHHSPALACCHTTPPPTPTPPTPPTALTPLHVFAAFLSPRSGSCSYWKRTRSLSICLCFVVRWHVPPPPATAAATVAPRLPRWSPTPERERREPLCMPQQSPLTIDLQLRLQKSAAPLNRSKT